MTVDEPGTERISSSDVVERATHDWTGTGTLGTTVVTAVARAAGVDPVDLSPLDDVVDPDALDALFAPRENGRLRRGGHVTFRLAGHRVYVSGDGAVLVCSDEAT